MDPKQEESNLGIFAIFKRKIARSLGRDDGASQNDEDALDYAADLVGLLSSSDDKSQDITFNPGNSETGGTTDPRKRRSKSKGRSKNTTSNGLTFSDRGVDVESMHDGRMVVNK